MRPLRRISRHLFLAMTIALIALGLNRVSAQSESDDLAADGGFDLSWKTIDGGGGISTDGTFELHGTIGQHDAGGPAVGGGFELVGGFWTGGGPVQLCPADITGDSLVNVQDLLAVINAWGLCPNPGNCPADVNGDGMVAVADLLAVINAWGSCP